MYKTLVFVAPKKKGPSLLNLSCHALSTVGGSYCTQRKKTNCWAEDDQFPCQSTVVLVVAFLIATIAIFEICQCSIDTILYLC